MVVDNIGRNGELHLANVANGDCVRPAGSLDHSREGADVAILGVHAHLERGVVRSMPEFHIGVKWPAIAALAAL